MKLKFIISAVLIGWSAVSAHAQEPVVIDEIIAKVDNYIVLKSDLERTYLDAVSNGATQSNLKCLILGSMIRDKLMVAKAEIDSVIVTPAEVDLNLSRRIDYILNQYNGSEEMILQYFGKTIEDIRSELRDQIEEQMTVERMQTHLTQDLTVTPTEVRRFFKRIPEDSLPYYDMEVKLAQISRNVTAGKEGKQAVIDQLIEIRKRIVAGEEFAQMATEYSQGPTGPNGGDLGWAKRGNMVPAFEAAALALKPGEVSMPVESQFGFHLIKMLERRGNEYHASHILMRPVSSQADINATIHFLDSIRTLIISDSTSFDKMAVEHSEDEETKGSGGYFLGSDASNMVSIRELAPDIYLAMDTMKVGTISSPLRFKKQDGSDAVRILLYESSRDPHQANLKDDWQKIQSAALIEKKNNELLRWFNEAVNEVFIDIDEEYGYCNIIN